MAYRRTERVNHRLAARRRAILEATRGIVADVGFRGLSMQVVAEATGVATGTLYRYFPSKGELCTEVVTAVSERELAVLREVAAGEGPPLPRLARAVATFARRALRARTLAWALLAEPVEPEVDRLRLGYRQEIADVIAGLVDECARSGTLPAQSASASAAFIVGAFIEGVIGPHAPAAGRAGPNAQALVNDIARFCLRGAGARARDLEAAGCDPVGRATA
jgi:AcrR family transcriptional regulator